MAIKDLLHFDGPAYTAKLESFVSSKNFLEIQKREIMKTRQIWGFSTKIGMGIILALPTMGLSAISSIIGMRQLWVACAKLNAITAIIRKYGITPHECELRDAVIPIVINVLTAGIGFGVSVGISDIAGMGWQEAAMHGVTPAVNHGIEGATSSALQDPGMFGHGVLHGMETQVDQVQAALLHPGDAASHVAQANVENAIPLGYGGSSAFTDGANIGVEMMPAAERFMIQQAIMSSLETAADDDLRRRLKQNAKS